MHSPSIPTIDSNLVSSSHSLNFLLLLFPLPSPSVLLLLGGRSGRPAPCHLCPPPPPPPGFLGVSPPVRRGGGGTTVMRKR